MTDELTDKDLEQIDAWCEQALEEYRLKGGRRLDRTGLCEYTDDLPSHSIRSQVVSLVAALRSERTQNQTADEDARNSLWSIMSECEGHRLGQSGYDITLDHIYELADVARAALSAQEESK